MQAELVREMELLWPLAEGPVLSRNEMKALAGFGVPVVIGRERATLAVCTNARCDSRAAGMRRGIRAWLRNW